MINIVSLRRTCPALPSQWEGETDDGRTVLIHYKRAILTVSYLGPNRRGRVEDFFRATLTESDFVDGEPYDDGFAEFPTIKSVLVKASVLSFPEGMTISDDF
ncbi:MAG: hypothetical protein HQL86_07775 [Magnetococcales bacterium]|nr:hypothetical protein [Magnetococcales bacterium]